MEEKKVSKVGRPPGSVAYTMPCGNGCGAVLHAAIIRDHLKNCPRRDNPAEWVALEQAEAAVIDCEVTP